VFFILSKALAVVLNPVCWLIFFLLWALFTKSVTRRKRLVGMVLFGSVLLTNPLLIRVAYRCWEVNPVEISSLDKIPYDGAIVLGGFGKENVKFGDRFEFGESANRLTQALELYHTGKVDRIIITGGSAAILTKKRSEGAAVERFLDRIKFPKEGLLVEGASRNSFENAHKTVELLKEKGADQEVFLLCTDGWHMRRARSCFEKAGLKVIPFSTSGERPLFDEPTPNRLLVPDMRGFERWSRLAKEMAGLFVYKISGKA
jgi:uncharacterized SAM-binding protein YcdF (DUF218 family)